MQTLSEIRRLLDERGLAPQKRHGQNFLVDKNLLAKLLELAELAGGETVLEVGPGTGTLTEELLARASKVVAVEIDPGLADLLRDRLGARPNFTLLCQDVLSGKHEIDPRVLAAVGERGVLVANLPYSIATPLLAECLLSSWHALHGKMGACRFDRLTFTVQREVADRLSAAAGEDAYGPVSVLAALLGRITLGPVVPPGAFWPAPGVHSRMLRIDFEEDKARCIQDVAILTGVVALAFSQRRKQIGSIGKRGGDRFPAEDVSSALQLAGVEPTVRPEQVPPEKFLALANALGRRQ